MSEDHRDGAALVSGHPSEAASHHALAELLHSTLRLVVFSSHRDIKNESNRGFNTNGPLRFLVLGVRLA
jgi:hypothetical protein